MTAASSWSTHQLVEFMAGVSASSDVESAMRLAVERAAEALEAEIGALLLPDRVVTSVGFPDANAPEAELLALAGAKDGDAAELPGVGPCRVAFASLHGDGGGRLMLGRLGDDPFGREDLNLLRGMGRVLSMTLHNLRLLEGERALRERTQRQADENMRLLQSLEERRRLHEQLVRIEQTISHRARLQEVLDAIVEGAAALLSDEIVVLRLLDANDPSLTITAASRGVDRADGTRRMPATRGLSGQAMAGARLVVLSPDGESLLPDIAGEGARAAVAVPVHEHGTVVGALVVASRDAERRYDQAEREMLTAFAEHASLALAAAKTVDTMRQAFTDPLTGLANRALFLDRLEHAFHRAERSDDEATVLFLDLDRFKLVNDSYGHAVGDELLIAVARRLQGCLRQAETAARLGGDEFAVLLEEEEGPRDAPRVAKRILQTLREPFVLHGKDVFISASIGIASAGTGTAEELLRDADVAMYRAKAQGKSCYRVFEPGMHAEVVERLELEADMQRALERGGFEIHYQPIVELAGGRIVGVEALVRLRHPERGLVPPGVFIPLAEETGLILPIGRFVLREACHQVAIWQADAPQSSPPLGLSVNLSGRQLQQPGTAAEVADAVTAAGLAPGSLTLELTETVLMQDTDLAVVRLEELRRLDVRLAIDDFGTGYSSLRYLQQLPIDVLKVAKPFVDALGREADEGAVARAIVDLARALKLDTVAEGIEEEGQAKRLLELGCRLGQGFHFARPMDAAALAERLLDAGRLPLEQPGPELVRGQRSAQVVALREGAAQRR
jgi:diguanylate cyclase (GGDEF)-like protein